ncbi:GPI-GlcNAc transferase complex, PIG-H component-domain-containing protein [Russula compacta]|nr:GPI-GlcNAc transferase complex, PIG-H component-domain-containing protein [Russula compacta]
MRRSRPLPEAHPELLIIDTPGLSREYRVENWHLSHSQHKRIISRLPWVSWLDVFLVMLVGLLWPSVKGNAVPIVVIGTGLSLLVYRKFTQVLWESILVLPPYGIQLETYRGLPSLPFFVSRRFIPLTEVQDVLINEGLRRWGVRYYLAVLYSPRQGEGEQRLEVAYENVLPRFPVLIKVYHDIHECLQNGIAGVQDIKNT